TSTTRSASARRTSAAPPCSSRWCSSRSSGGRSSFRSFSAPGSLFGPLARQSNPLSGGLREELPRVAVAHAREREEEGNEGRVSFGDHGGIAAYPRAGIEIAAKHRRRHRIAHRREDVEGQGRARIDAIVFRARRALPRGAMDRGRA